MYASLIEKCENIDNKNVKTIANCEDNIRLQK